MEDLNRIQNGASAIDKVIEIANKLDGTLLTLELNQQIPFLKGFMQCLEWKIENEKKTYTYEEVLKILDFMLSEYKSSLENNTEFHPALLLEQFKK